MLITSYEEAVNCYDYDALSDKIWKKNESVKVTAICSRKKYKIDRPDLKTIGVRGEHADGYYDMCGVFADPDIVHPPLLVGADAECYVLTKSVRNKPRGVVNTAKGAEDAKEPLVTAIEMAYEVLKAQGWHSSKYRVLGFGFEFSYDMMVDIYGIADEHVKAMHSVDTVSNNNSVLNGRDASVCALKS